MSETRTKVRLKRHIRAWKPWLILCFALGILAPLFIEGIRHINELGPSRYSLMGSLVFWTGAIILTPLLTWSLFPTMCDTDREEQDGDAE